MTNFAGLFQFPNSTKGPIAWPSLEPIPRSAPASSRCRERTGYSAKAASTARSAPASNPTGDLGIPIPFFRPNEPNWAFRNATWRDSGNLRLQDSPALEDDRPGLVDQFRAMRLLTADCGHGQVSGFAQGCIHQFSAGELAAAIQVEPIRHSAGLAVGSPSPGTPRLRPDEVLAGQTGCCDPQEFCCRRCRSPAGGADGGGECCCERKPWQSFRTGRGAGAVN